MIRETQQAVAYHLASAERCVRECETLVANQRARVRYMEGKGKNLHGIAPFLGAAGESPGDFHRGQRSTEGERGRARYRRARS